MRLTVHLPSEMLSVNMTENQALTKLGPKVFQACSGPWKKAWDDIRGPLNNPSYSNRIRSDLLREHAAIYGQETLPQLGFTYLWDQGQHLFVSEDAVLVFRIVDEWRRAHRPATQRAEMLMQSVLFPDVPTLIVGLLPSMNWTEYSLYICRPNANGSGNAWTFDITTGVALLDASQDKFTNIIEETEFEAPQKPKQKFKPKYDPNIGESSKAAGSGENDGK